MNNNKRLKKNSGGSALVYALIITSASLIILVSMLQYVASQIKYGLYAASKEESFQISESGINFYRWYLAHQTNGKTAEQVKAFWTSGSPLGVSAPYEAEYKDPSGSAIGKYSLEVTPPVSGSTIVTVKATGWTYKYPDSKRIIQVRLRRPAWSEYSVLSNAFVRFGSGTEVYGKVFANNGVHFDGVAHNAVYSAVSSYYDIDFDVKAIKPGVWTSWSNEYNSDMASNVFLAGKSYPVTDKDFSSVTADMNLMKTKAQTAGTNACSSSACYFDSSGQGRSIVLNSDGTFKAITVQSYNGSTNAISNYMGSWDTYAIPDNGVIFVEGNVWLEGTLNGKMVTIVAARLSSSDQANVFIQHDITYGNYDGSAILGVIAQNNVETIKDSEDDLRIDGAYLAQNGRVGREDYNDKSDIKSVITVYGAIASNQRYGFAWSDSDGNNWGYANRNLYYDNNLLYFPPPYFPTGDEYLMDLWEEL